MQEFVESGDVGSLIVLIVILCWIGSLMLRSQPALGLWAWRCAAAAFIGYCLVSGMELDYPTPGAWLSIVWHGLLAAGLTLGASRIVLAVYGLLKSASDRAAQNAKSMADARRRDKERKEREREEARRHEEWEREAPERERLWQIAEERRLKEEAVRADARQTREDTRYACELFYNLHAPKIGDRFTKQDLHDFMNRYMGDQQPLDVLRRRANQLTETIRQHVDAVDPPEAMGSLEELADWYATQKAQIDKLEVEPDFKHEFCLQLKERYTDLTQRILEEVNP